MSNSEIDMPSLLEKLETILDLLDNSGHSVAAIKVEEAINALKLSEQNENKNNENS